MVQGCCFLRASKVWMIKMITLEWKCNHENHPNLTSCCWLNFVHMKQLKTWLHLTGGIEVVFIDQDWLCGVWWPFDFSKKCTWSFCLVIANKVSLVIWACYCWCSWTQIWVRRMARVGELRVHPTKTILLTHFHASEETYHGLLRVRGESFHHLCHWESMIWQDLVMFQSTGPKGGRQIGWIRVLPSSTRARPE